jgi:hypothetical protein
VAEVVWRIAPVLSPKHPRIGIGHSGFGAGGAGSKIGASGVLTATRSFLRHLLFRGAFYRSCEVAGTGGCRSPPFYRVYSKGRMCDP